MEYIDLVKIVKQRYEEEGGSKLAKELGVSKSVIKHLACKFGIKKRTRNPEFLSRLTEAIKNRYTKEGPDNISKEFNVKKDKIYKLAHKLKIKCSRSFYPNLNEAIRERYSTEGSAGIANDFGIAATFVIKRASYIKVRCRNNIVNGHVTKRNKNPELKALIVTIACRYEIEGPQKLSKELNVPYRKIVRIANYRGITFKKRKNNDKAPNLLP